MVTPKSDVSHGEDRRSVRGLLWKVPRYNWKVYLATAVSPDTSLQLEGVSGQLEGASRRYLVTTRKRIDGKVRCQNCGRFHLPRSKAGPSDVPRRPADTEKVMNVAPRSLLPQHPSRTAHTILARHITMTSRVCIARLCFSCYSSRWLLRKGPHQSIQSMVKGVVSVGGGFLSRDAPEQHLHTGDWRTKLNTEKARVRLRPAD